MIHVGGTSVATIVNAPTDGKYISQILFVIRGADLTSTADQAFTKLFTGTNWFVSRVITVRKTWAFGITCAGGIYTGASKSGNAIVGALQSYAGLSGAGKLADLTLAAILGTDVQTSSNLYLSLTSGNTGALTADIFVLGFCTD